MHLWLLLIACENEESSFSFASTSQSVSGSESEVTWYDHIQPMMEKHCVRCHNEDGVAVGNFRDSDDVIALAPLMLNAMSDGRMPPPSSDPNCRDYYDSDILHLPTGSINLFSRWLNNNHPLGQVANEQTYDNGDRALEEANLELMMTKDYHPAFNSDLLIGNEYRCFVLEHGQTETFYVNAIHPAIGNLKMTHHLSIDLAEIENIPEGYFSEDGFDCLNAEGVGDMLIGWGPGMTPQRFPEGVGVKIEPNQAFILEMHYNRGDLSTAELLDKSGISMVVYDEVDTELHLQEIGIRDFLIEAGDPDYTASKTFTFEERTKVWSVWPHMHNLGAGFDMHGRKNNEEICVVQSDGYLYESQQTYILKEPITFETQDEITMACNFNNSDSNPNLLSYPPQDTSPGFGTENEMCEWFLLVSH